MDEAIDESNDKLESAVIAIAVFLFHCINCQQVLTYTQTCDKGRFDASIVAVIFYAVPFIALTLFSMYSFLRMLNVLPRANFNFKRNIIAQVMFAAPMAAFGYSFNEDIMTISVIVLLGFIFIQFVDAVLLSTIDRRKLYEYILTLLWIALTAAFVIGNKYYDHWWQNGHHRDNIGGVPRDYYLKNGYETGIEKKFYPNGSISSITNHSSTKLGDTTLKEFDTIGRLVFYEYDTMIDGTRKHLAHRKTYNPDGTLWINSILINRGSGPWQNCYYYKTGEPRALEVGVAYKVNSYLYDKNTGNIIDSVPAHPMPGWLHNDKEP